LRTLGRMMEAGLIRESDKKIDGELDDEAAPITK
jgi:hypothetical protein